MAIARAKTRVSGGRFEAGETAVGKVAKARAETEAEHSAEREDMVGRAPGVGVMFDDLKRRAVVQKAVEHIRRLVRSRRNNRRMIRAMSIRHMRVEGEAGIDAVAGIHVAGIVPPLA